MTNLKRLIVVDDDEQVVYLIKAALEKRYTVEGFTHPIQAYQAFLKNPCCLFLTDLMMPEMSGEELVSKLTQHENSPLILVLTSISDLNTVIQLMRNGAYDYMLKPIRVDDLLSRVEKAFEVAELRRMQKIVEKERQLRIESQLNWNLWKESAMKKSFDKVEGNLISNLNSSLVQGAGIGTITTLIQMIEQASQPQEDSYLVPKDLMDMLFENAAISNHLTMMLGDINYIINNPFNLKPINLKDLHNLIQSEINYLQSFQEKRNHTIKLGSNPAMTNTAHSVNLELEYFSKAIRELLLNAMKFSLESTDIYILFEIIKDKLHIHILNHPQTQNEVYGIPEEYSRLVFEPFFRIARTVHEEYQTLDFGLGLTLVEKVIHQHNGKITVQNLKNYLNFSSGNLVCFSIELPMD